MLLICLACFEIFEVTDQEFIPGETACACGSIELQIYEENPEGKEVDDNGNQ